MVEAADTKKRGTLPPYIAFKTLIDIVERMEREEPPTRVDGSYLDSYAGGYRPTVINNLQTLGLLNTAGEPTEKLKALIKASEAERKVQIADILRATYPDVVALNKYSTQQQFLDAFTAMGVSGDTRRKAISFFLKAATFAGLPTGMHWKTPAAQVGGTRRRAKAATDNGQKVDTPAQEEVAATPSVAGGETVTINFGDAGSVVVNVAVKWLQLDDATFAKLRKVINDLKALVPAESALADDEDEEEHNDEGGDDA